VDENKRLTELVDYRKDEIHKLRTEKAELEETLQRTRSDKVELGAELQRRKLEVQSIEDDNNRIEGALEQMLTELNRLTNKNEQLQKELRENEAKTARLEEEMTQNEKKVHKKVTEKEALKNESESVGHYLHKLETLTETQRKDIGKLNDRMQEHQMISESLENEKRALEEKLVSIEKEDLERKLESTEERIKSLGESREESEDKVQQKEKEVEFLISRINQLKADMEVKTATAEQLADEKSEVERALQAQDSEIDCLREDIAKLKDVLLNKEQTFDRLTEEMSRLRNRDPEWYSSAAGNRIYTDVIDGQNGTAANMKLGEGRRGRQTHSLNANSSLSSGLGLKGTQIELGKDDKKEATNQTGEQEHKNTSARETNSDVVEQRRRSSLDSGATNRNSTLTRRLSKSKTDLTSVTDGTRGRAAM
jgi:hypothetical protein